MKTTVIFRKERGGSIVAVMPYEIADLSGNMTSYSHIGQHSAMSPEYLRDTAPAREDEYRELLDELVNIVGYDPEIRRRIDWGKYSARVQETRREHTGGKNEDPDKK